MNDIVWAVNPQNDNFENIILHMRAFGGELLAGKDIALHFKADSGLNNIILSMEMQGYIFSGKQLTTKGSHVEYDVFEIIIDRKSVV